MCNQLSPADQRRLRKIHDRDQRQAGADRYVDAARLCRYRAEEVRRMGNPPEAARLDDVASNCDAVANDILAGRRQRNYSAEIESLLSALERIASLLGPHSRHSQVTSEKAYQVAMEAISTPPGVDSTAPAPNTNL